MIRSFCPFKVLAVLRRVESDLGSDYLYMLYDSDITKIAFNAIIIGRPPTSPSKIHRAVCSIGGVKKRSVSHMGSDIMAFGINVRGMYVTFSVVRVSSRE